MLTRGQRRVRQKSKILWVSAVWDFAYTESTQHQIPSACTEAAQNTRIHRVNLKWQNRQTFDLSEKGRRHWVLTIVFPIEICWYRKKWDQQNLYICTLSRQRSQMSFSSGTHIVYGWADSLKDFWSLPRNNVMGNRFRQAVLSNRSFSSGNAHK